MVDKSISFFPINTVLWTIQGSIYQDVDDQVNVEPIIFNSKYFYGIYLLHRRRVTKLQESLYG